MLPPGRAVRIVLVELRGLMADFVKLAITGQPDMELVDELLSATDLSAVLRERDVDVVVTALASPQLPLEYQALPFGAMPVCVVAISRDRRDVEVYERRVIREIAREQLIDVIRTVGQHRPLD